MTIDIQATLSLLVSAIVIIGAIIAGFLRVKKWVADIAAGTKETQAQLTTSDNKTIADHVEDTSREITQINVHIEDLGKSARENRETSIAALTLARHLNERFDSHLVNEHGVHATDHKEH